MTGITSLLDSGSTRCAATVGRGPEIEPRLLLAKGIAHISFRGGAIFLPARNPYDRETLIEHVTHSIRAWGRVQVLIEDQAWQVYPVTDESAATCTRCSRQVLEATCHTCGDAIAAYCIRCAFASHTQAADCSAGQAREDDVMNVGCTSTAEV